MTFVPLNAAVPLAVTVEPDIAYSLILFRERGTNGWATFADGGLTQRVHGTTNVLIRGVEVCKELKNLRLRAVTDAGGELFQRDFTVGEISFEVRDEWNGAKAVPWSSESNTPVAVAPGDFI